MKLKTTICIIGLLIISLSSLAEPANIDVKVRELLQYYNSGQYMAELSSVTKQAKNKLAQAIQNNINNKKLAIVLDVDDTSISNFKKVATIYKLINYAGMYLPKKEMDIIHNKFADPVIKPTFELYQYAIKHNVAVFFITGRIGDPAMCKGTLTNLKNAGYTKYTKIFFGKLGVGAKEYKINIRKKLTQQGYDIVLNIGDQKSDLIGGYADYKFKLPNPFYFVPTHAY